MDMTSDKQQEEKKNDLLGKRRIVKIQAKI